MTDSIHWTSFHWIVFAITVTVLLALDLFIFHKNSRQQTFKESLLWTIFWVSCSLAFNLFIWSSSNSEAAITYFTGYLIEWSLSIDNVFVFAIIFSFFSVPDKYQYRILFWGILGAIVIRLAFIMIGIELVHKFEWMMLIFGAFLIYTAYKLAFKKGDATSPENNALVKFARKFLPVYEGDPQGKFFIKENHKLMVTPLFLVLLVIESTDVVFAVDSIPAIIGITTDKYLVYTSNVFAILGLRSLYFLLSGVMNMFKHLKYGLCAILTFIGIKMCYEYLVGSKMISPTNSLVVIATVLAISIISSIISNKREQKRAKG